MGKKFFFLIFIFFTCYFIILQINVTLLPSKHFEAGTAIATDIKPVSINGYKVFNSGVIPINEGLLFASRRKGTSWVASLLQRFFFKSNTKDIAIGVLDDDLTEKKSLTTYLQTQESIGGLYPEYMDPRLIKVGDEIYMVYCRQINRTTREASEAALYLAKLEKNDAKWNVVSDKKLVFPSSKEFYRKNLVQRNFEKNWMPFSKDGKLFFIYLVYPEHIILNACLNTGQCSIHSRTQNNHIPHQKDIRGGTPAVFDKELGEWITLYHYVYPSKKWLTRKKVDAYFMGAYTFADNDHFNILRMSKSPIVGDTLYDNFHKIIFPMALIRDGDDYLIFYGNDDIVNKVCRIKRSELIGSLEIIKEKGNETSCSSN